MERKHNKSLLPTAKALRKNMTREECRLWYDFLREYPVKIRRQKIIGKYIVDFYCASANLVIELDGSQHYEAENVEKDRQRSEFLADYGITTIRFTNIEVKRNFTAVCEYIDMQIKKMIEEGKQND